MTLVSFLDFPNILPKLVQHTPSDARRTCALPYFLLSILFISCDQPLPQDDCCQYMENLHSIEFKDGQGVVQVDGSTSTSYYVVNGKGEPVGHQLLNRALALDAGSYTVKVNNTTHTVHILSGKATRCATGTLMVSGPASGYYSVLDTTGIQLGSETLGKAMSFFPSGLRIRVNDTELGANVKVRELTEIRTGSILVKGTTGEYYYVLDKGNKQLNYASLGKPLAFLPGSYVVKINNTSRTLDVMAGTPTEIPTGNLMVKGLTEEYYYVTDTAGNALNYQTLNKPLAFFPGQLHVTVNNTIADAEILAGQTTEFVTGSLMLTGGGTGYYYVLDELGNQLNYNSLNKSLSLFPSEYTIRLGQSTRKATVVGGQLTSVSASN